RGEHQPQPHDRGEGTRFDDRVAQTMTSLRRLSALLSLGALAAALVATFVLAPAVYADTSGPLSPSTVVDDSSAGFNSWTNPTNATSSNDSYATATAGNNG